MTSLDDDGSTAKNSPPDDVRLSAPADPWLTEAPTSAINDTPTLPDLATAPQAPPPDPAPFPDWYRPHHDRGRRRRRLVVTGLAVGAVFLAGMLALDPFGSDDDGRDTTGPAPSPSTTTTTAGARPAAGTPATTASAAVSTSVAPAASTVAAPAAGAPHVVYEVTASGSKNTGSVAYTDQDGDIIRRNGIPLPWRTTFALGGQRKPLVLDVQRKGGGDTGPVTCTITVDGKLLSTTTAEGRYAAALCSGSG